MATASIYPDATELGDWTPTPSTVDHHTLVDDNSDDTDYISVNGYVAAKQEILNFPVGPANINYITQYNVMIRLKGVNIVTDPGLLVELLVNGSVKASYQMNATVGLFTSTLISFGGLFISNADWVSGPRQLRFTPLDAGGGLPNFEEE